MNIGTNYFLTRWHIREYYKQYGYDDIDTVIAQKLASGEVCIGTPLPRDGYLLRMNNDGRFIYVKRG